MPTSVQWSERVLLNIKEHLLLPCSREGNDSILIRRPASSGWQTMQWSEGVLLNIKEHHAIERVRGLPAVIKKDHFLFVFSCFCLAIACRLTTTTSCCFIIFSSSCVVTPVLLAFCLAWTILQGLLCFSLFLLQ